MTPAPHVVVCPFIDPGGAGTVQDSYRILDLFRGIFARSSLEPIHGSARPCAPVHQSKTKASSAVVGEPRCAHTQVFSPPFSRWTKVSLASPLPPHEFAGRPESPEVYRVPVPNHGAGVLVLTEAAEPSLEDGAATQLTD